MALTSASAKLRWLVEDRRHLLVPFVCLSSLILAGLIASAAATALHQPYSGLQWSSASGIVQAVDSDSPAFIAGLRAGDVIVAVDGEPWSSTLNVYAAHTAGESVTWSVARGEQKLTTRFQFILPTRLAILQRLIPLLMALSCAAFGFFVWAHKLYDPVVILFLGINQLGAAVLALGLLSTFYLTWASFWFNLSLLILSAALIHFHWIFLQPKAASGKRWLLGLYGLALFVASLHALNSRQSLGGIWEALARNGARLYFASAGLSVVILLIHGYFATSDLSDRRRIRLVAFGTALALTPLSGLSILPEAFTGSTWLPYEITLPLLLVIPIAYAVGIFKWRLLQIDRLINRGVVSMTLLLSMSLICLGLPFSLFRLWPITPVQQSLVWGLITLLAVSIFAPLRQQLQALADRLFYGGWYNYRSVIDEMSQALSGIMDSRELAQLLVERLPKILCLRGAVLLLPSDKETLTVVEANGSASAQTFPRHLPRTGKLARALGQMSRPLTTLELQAALANRSIDTEEQAWLSNPDLKLWLPLARGAKLQGVLLLGATTGEGAFDAQDRSMLNTLACQAAIAAENIELVKACQRRADEINGLYSQLMQSREDERKRLARELHDQVIQDLVNLHYYLDVNAPPLAPTAQGQAQALRERTHNIIASLRQVCTELRPPALDDLNLGLAMQGYIDEMNAKHDLDIVLQVREESVSIDDLSEEISLCLFRALQEALTNARRHAQTTQIEVELSVTFKHVTLEVRDKGQGFRCPSSLGEFIRGGHFGLAGLQERMNLVGGTLCIESAPGQGTLLSARIPRETPPPSKIVDPGG